MQVLQQFVTDPHSCHYLPEQVAMLHYSLAPAMTALEYEALMNSGHRKFGPVFFRPVCEGCTECRPLRVPTAEFKPSRSQRRAWKRNQDLRTQLAPASVDEMRLALYDRYHRSQNERKGWRADPSSASEYELSYVHNPIPNVEISLWEGAVLRAIIHNDVTPNTVSAIYHFHDPDFLDRSLGTYCILQSIDLARRLKKRWVYLGYFVAGCSSLSYKSLYRPCEIMKPDGKWTQI
jgi:arginyl-tRNA--protein-N-Asp/Glu arginylyltransferase